MSKCSFGPLVIANLEDLASLAKACAACLRPKDVLALSGPVGVGKTTWAQSLIQQILPGQWVSSPSFPIINTYPGDQPVFHMDWYRLESSQALDLLDLPYYFENPQAISIIEWADKFPEQLPDHTIELKFSFADQDSQRILQFSMSSEQAKGFDFLSSY